jgi:chromate transporter
VAVEKFHPAGFGSCVHWIIVGSCFTMAKGAITGLETAAIAVGVLLMLLQYKINPALLVLAGAVIGAFSFISK